MLGVESIGNCFLQAGHKIAIGIHGDFDRCVAKSLLNDLGLCAQLYEHGCMRMPQIMVSCFWHGWNSGSISLLIYTVDETLEGLGIAIWRIWLTGS